MGESKEEIIKETVNKILKLIDKRESAYQANNQPHKAIACSWLYHDISRLFEIIEKV